MYLAHLLEKVGDGDHRSLWLEKANILIPYKLHNNTTIHDRRLLCTSFGKSLFTIGCGCPRRRPQWHCWRNLQARCRLLGWNRRTCTSWVQCPWPRRPLSVHICCWSTREQVRCRWPRLRIKSNIQKNILFLRNNDCGTNTL